MEPTTVTKDKRHGAPEATLFAAGPFTSGPWRVAECQHHADWWFNPYPLIRECVVVSPSAERAVCATNDDGVPTVEEMANAVLIAAAPELFRLVRLLNNALKANGLDPVDRDYASISEQADLLVARVISGVTGADVSSPGEEKKR